MYQHILIIILCGLCCAQPLQGKPRKPLHELRQKNPATIRVHGAGGGRIRITNATNRTTLHLERDISGCLHLYDHLAPKWHSNVSAKIKVIDKVSKDSKYYVVLFASAPSNCNVQGHCGAGGEDYTVIWLKLDTRLRLEDKKRAVIEDCQSNISTKRGDTDTEEPAVKLVDGKLAVEYGDEFGDPKKRTVSHLIYDRNFPEKGFVITTEEVKTPAGY